MLVAFFGSIVNVGIVLYLLSIQQRLPTDYGLVGASISIGLVLGPLAMGAVAKENTQRGIGLAGIATGTAIIGLFQPFPLVFTMIAGFLLGIGNGGQNVFVNSLLMKAIPETQRTRLIPAFVSCIYFFVFSSYIAGLFLNQDNVVAPMLCGGATTILLGVFSLTRKPIANLNQANFN